MALHISTQNHKSCLIKGKSPAFPQSFLQYTIVGVKTPAAKRRYSISILAYSMRKCQDVFT